MASITSAPAVGSISSTGTVAAAKGKREVESAVSVSFNSDYMRIRSEVEPPRLDKVMSVRFAIDNGTADSTIFTKEALERALDLALIDIREGKA